MTAVPVRPLSPRELAKRLLGNPRDYLHLSIESAEAHLAARLAMAEKLIDEQQIAWLEVAAQEVRNHHIDARSLGREEVRDMIAGWVIGVRDTWRRFWNAKETG